jgi:beta-mannosidase
MGRAAQGSPEDHLWGARDYFKSDFYKNAPAHFVSEMGYHGCPSLESIKKFISPEKVWPYQNNSEWILHSADQNGDDGRVMLMHKQVRQLFGEIPTDPETYITASQLSQAEAKKFFIEHMRIGRPTKCGIIWWNLLDGWPQMSDAVVDYYYDKKIAYRYIKRSQAPFSVAVDEIQNWGSGVFALNDTLTEKRGKVKITDAETGEVMREFSFTAPKNASTRITTLPLFYSDHKMLIIDWELEDGECGRNHFLVGYPPFDLKKYVEWAKKYDI